MQLSDKAKKEQLLENMGKLRGLNMVIVRLQKEKEAIQAQLNEVRRENQENRGDNKESLRRWNMTTLEGQQVLIDRLQKWTQAEFEEILIKTDN